MSSRRIIVKRNGQYLNVWWKDGEIIQIDVEDVQPQKLMVGDIYVARVRDIVSNIQAAFLEIDAGRIAYYSLKDNKNPLFCQCARKEKLTVGDSLVVQITKESMKTKYAVASSCLNLTGRYMVLIRDSAGICFSSKIHDGAWKKEMQKKLAKRLEENGLWTAQSEFGYIIRTNAYEASEEEIWKDMETLTAQYQTICRIAPYRKSGVCLKKMPSEYLLSIRDGAQDLERIVTDEPEVYEEIKQYMSQENMPNFQLELYQDSILPLIKLYSIEKSIELAQKEYVWMRSGAYLVIQPTEALTVIDVNTGKIVAKGANSGNEETFLKVNLEAVGEIAKQIRLRNYSGIILVDFINMKRQENRQMLMAKLQEAVQRDPVKTVVVDMTALELVELTRQKKRAPLHEALR